MSNHRRTKLTFSAIALGGMLVLSSTAFACTVFKGRMTVSQGSNPKASAVGNNLGMNSCVTPVPQTGTADDAAAFTVTVKPTVAGVDTDTVCYASLGNSSGLGFQVLYTTATGHCMAGSAGAVKIGNIPVTGGNGTGSYSVPAGTLGAAKVCVSDNGASKGMEVTVNFI